MARLTGLEPATPGVTGRYSNQLSYNRAFQRSAIGEVARLTGLEPATPGVTGRYSNQLSYNRSPPPDRCPSVGRVYAGPRAPSSDSVRKVSVFLLPLPCATETPDFQIKMAPSITEGARFADQAR